MKKELILKEIDQLENAICSFSNSTNWVKKSNAPVVAIFISLFVTETASLQKILVAFLVYTFCSWLIDSYCYYFQKNLRYAMGEKFKLLDPEWPYWGKNVNKASVLDALFNRSHILYYVSFGFVTFFLLGYFISFEFFSCGCCTCGT